ncbi:chromosomal replication initiator protein DnaA [Roseomonas indoligenes]|uniref:Chromosomal replication initiator protein DnaA n=1 Tax=Roseomonas indoligenes TaxID=2820811 RepID=A0A940N5V0_9PROT|nr:chromosomal replication initiator protein DnaA [Pararoseomonas indoligenes]MBP0494707.1 chromosomal replication initiator protein DnaA [Pararoseomonas indoligenes]
MPEQHAEVASAVPAQGLPDSGAADPARLDAAWARIRGRLREEVGEAEYRTWLRQLTLAGVEGEEAVVHVPTRFLRDWLRGQYGDRLRALWQAEAVGVRRVDIRVASAGAPAPEAAPAAAPPPVVAEQAEPAARPVPEAARPDPRGDWAAPLDPRFTFDSFIVGKPNEFAHACARRVAEKPNSPGFNPLFLYGGVGLGKTHLMHSIAWAIREPQAGGPGRSVAYMSAEKFMYRFIAALRSQSTMEFKESLRSVDVLMIDDLQFLIGKDNTQEEFFHTFNALVDQGKQIVVSSDKPPSDLAGLEDRLRTRLGCGMVADIHATTYELRISILESKAATAGVDVPARVLEFLAHKITSNVRELEGALNRLIAHANLFGRPVTLESCQEVLHDILRAHDRRVTIEEIQKRVAEHYNIRLTDMSSARRARNVARPRQVAMYLSKQLTSRSLPEIGRRFGNRDHTTVMHAVSRVAELMQGDAGFAEDVELLRRMLET